MPMTSDARAAANELTARCEKRLTLIVLNPDDAAMHAADIEALLLDAEHAGRCPRVIIWRLRQRLAFALAVRNLPTPRPIQGPAHG